MLAWQLYGDACSPIGAVLLQLEDIELTEYNACELAIKLRALHNKIAEMDRQEAEESARTAAGNRPR